MDRNREINYRVNLGFADVFFVVFLVLKLVGVIDWPWIWVFAPIWISVIVAISVVLIMHWVDKKRIR